MTTPIQKIIDEYKSISLSDSEVMRLVGHKARILLYRELKPFKSLKEMLGHHGAVFLLYETSKNYGHWVCVIEQTPDTIEFFDPYGYFVDDQLDWVGPHTRKVLGQDTPYLSALLYESSYPNLVYNNYKFQKKGEGINTCGRWSALRIAMRSMDLEEFKKNFYGKNSDDLVTILTS